MMNRKKNASLVVAGLLSGMMVMSPLLPASAKAETEAPAVPKTVEGVEAPYETDAFAGATVKRAKTPWEQEEAAKAAKEQASAETTTKPTRTWEIQAEYLEGRFFKERHIDDYNLHIYRKYRDVNHISVWYGGTLSRPVGYTTEDGIYRDSEAVGLGPSMMLRWERPLAGRYTGSIDGTGSLLFYNQAHPGDGRAYGFLWRIGPRLIYHATNKDAVSLAYLFHHSSNGMHDHNPGYNGVGFSLGYAHTF